MKWGYWIELYLNVHCTARGLRAKTIAAYGDALRQFQRWAIAQDAKACPSAITASQVLTCQRSPKFPQFGHQISPPG